MSRIRLVTPVTSRDAKRMSGTESRYDVIGRSYAQTRREDPRIAAQIHPTLGGGTLVNVGAGSGNYEPTDRRVVAVEPSAQMIRQRSGRRAPVVRGVAESLPFTNCSFDVALAVLTIHHWSDPVAGLLEMARVATRQVVFFFEPLQIHSFWAIEYFPAALALPIEQNPPGERMLRDHLNVQEVRKVLVPNDCIDGFGVAFWARPEEYLKPEVQAGMSWLAMLSEQERQEGAAHLRADLSSGEWDRRHRHLRHQDVFDGGYRIAIASSS